MAVSDLGEFALIQRLAATAGRPPPENLILGIGDDAAAWRSGEAVLLATTDTLIAGVHFLPQSTPWRDVGWKVLAVNVSDIAAMGGIPQFALLTLALPPTFSIADLDQMYAGLQECAEAYNITLIGGDIVRAQEIAVTVALLGQAQLNEKGDPLLLRRDAARPGDIIAVSGTLGDSAAGLRLLQQDHPPSNPLIDAHLRPQPPLGAAQEAARLGVRCAIDISDGLLQDLGHICRMSKVGSKLYAQRIPLSDQLRQAFPAEALSLASNGGEDYQLLLLAPPNLLPKLQAHVDVPLSTIGEAVADESCRVRLLDETGKELALAPSGWDHLRPS